MNTKRKLLIVLVVAIIATLSVSVVALAADTWDYAPEVVFYDEGGFVGEFADVTPFNIPCDGGWKGGGTLPQPQPQPEPSPPLRQNTIHPPRCYWFWCDWICNNVRGGCFCTWRP